MCQCVLVCVCVCVCMCVCETEKEILAFSLCFLNISKLSKRMLDMNIAALRLPVTRAHSDKCLFTRHRTQMCSKD